MRAQAIEHPDTNWGSHNAGSYPSPLKPNQLQSADACRHYEH